MSKLTTKKRIAIIGGGPSGLFMYKRLVESGQTNIEIEIFERKGFLGAGMPYSEEGANVEHITNVSDNEIPGIFNSIEDWVKVAPKDILEKFQISSANFNEFKVLPRLFFGEYLKAQFDLLKASADEKGIVTRVHLNCLVNDLIDRPEHQMVSVVTAQNPVSDFHHVMICSGHNWPQKFEGKIDGYYDSPYPPKKLLLKINHPVAIMGSSLTAIDAVRTLAKLNGNFEEGEDGKLVFKLNEDSKDFKLILHSRNGLLPAVRFHLKDSHLSKDETLTRQEFMRNIKENGGFVDLDYVFEKNFKETFIKNDPSFHKIIKDMNLEEFVDAMMNMRESMEPFELLKKEYEEAEKSIERKESIYWKEALAILSFAMNYPAKYLSAEDMQRLQHILMPLISVVIAFVPQSSCRVLMALHDAGALEIVTVGKDSEVEPIQSGGIVYHYTDSENQKQAVSFKTFVNCVGQPHLAFEDFPFKSLIEKEVVSPAKLRFKSEEKGDSALRDGNDLVNVENGNHFLKVPGITINDNFNVIDKQGRVNNRIYIMAVPYIGGYNPDYSGIDFSESASEAVVESLFRN
ncbi:FAD/NAD(P)-binding protein [Pedobacter frigidisoli]|uniref:FAD/NAD(P)-binding protein n=1 Tax=Pedobacter frigidisoli TaxID=2530455 RepID=UPI00292E41B0|nr:FAD/NAD(P)-binding protein [Pedobacter frigidisoli]